MSRLADLGSKLFNANKDFRPKIVPTQKLVRGVLNSQYIFSTSAALLVWETYHPDYWVPKSSFFPIAKFTDNPSMSGIQSSTAKLTVGNKSIDVLIVPDSFNSELAGYVKLEFGDLDAWYEETQKVMFYPKDIYHRVDTIPSGRTVRVEFEGTVLADTEKEGGVMSLWETNLPGRWYLPPSSVRWEYLRPSQTHTACPYKGQASYYDVVINGKVIKDAVWWYEGPLYESAAIRGMLCFYPSKVSTFVDGIPVEQLGAKPVKKAEPVAQPRSSCNC